MAKDAYSALETKLNKKSKRKSKADMDEREEDQDEEDSGSDEDEYNHAEDEELSTSLQTSTDGSKVHEEDTQFTGRTDSNDILSMEKEQEEATTVTSAEVPVSAEDHSFNQEAEQEDLLKKDAHGETVAPGMDFQVDDNAELWPLDKETSAAEVTVTSPTAPLKSAPSIERGESFEVSAPKTLRHQGGRGFLVGPGGFQTSFHSTAEDLSLIHI